MRVTALIAFITLLLSAPLQAGEGARFSICEHQVRHYVEDTLGQTIERIQINWSYSISEDGAEEPSHALVYTAQCPGHHWFELLGNYGTCVDLPYYGSEPTLIFYRGGFKGC